MSGTPRRARSITEFCDHYGLGRTKVYDEIGQGRLKVLKVGTRSIITPENEDVWLASLPELKPSDLAL